MPPPVQVGGLRAGWPEEKPGDGHSDTVATDLPPDSLHTIPRTRVFLPAFAS